MLSSTVSYLRNTFRLGPDGFLAESVLSLRFRDGDVGSRILELWPCFAGDDGRRRLIGHIHRFGLHNFHGAIAAAERGKNVFRGVVAALFSFLRRCAGKVAAQREAVLRRTLPDAELSKHLRAQQGVEPSRPAPRSARPHPVVTAFEAVRDLLTQAPTKAPMHAHADTPTTSPPVEAPADDENGPPPGFLEGLKRQLARKVLEDPKTRHMRKPGGTTGPAIVPVGGIRKKEPRTIDPRAELLVRAARENASP